MRFHISEKDDIVAEDGHRLSLRAKKKLLHLPLNPLYLCKSSS